MKNFFGGECDVIMSDMKIEMTSVKIKTGATCHKFGQVVYSAR